MTAFLTNGKVHKVLHVFEDIIKHVFVDCANKLSNIGFKFNKSSCTLLEYVVFDVAPQA